MTELATTPALAWRQPREQGVVVTLPSGNVARLRPVALDVLIMSGILPDILTPTAAKALWTETDTSDIGNQAEAAQNFAALISVVVRASFMQPVIVDNPTTDNEIGDDDVDFFDKITVFRLATGPAEALRQFRFQQSAGMDTLFNGQDDSPAAQ